MASCKETVSRNFGNLSRRAKMRQRELIRATLGIESEQMDGEPVAMRNGSNACGTTINRARSAFTPFVFHHRIVRRLMANSLHTEGRWLWATPNLIGMKNPELTFGVSVSGLYDGLVGIGLYFMNLHALIGGAQYKRVFENILQSVLDWEAANEESPMSGGLFDGRSGLGLFMIAAGDDAHDNSLIEMGYRELLHANTNCAEDTKWDVISGLSGHVLALANAQDLLGDTELLSAIRKAATCLLQRAVEVNGGIAWKDTDFSNNLPLAGFAHGAAGASAALAMAGKLCSCEAFVDGAWQAVAYESTQYMENARNWRDNRTFEKGVDQNQDNNTDLIGWCHGAAGIGLARSLLVPVSRSSEEEGYLRRDINRLKDSTYLQVGSDCLCHGILGNLACAQRAALAINDQGWQNDVNALAARVLDNLFDREPVIGFGDDHLRKLYPQNPSLMCGISGIGLGSLCLLQPDRVGLVLAGEMIHPSKCREASPARSGMRSATPVSVSA